MISFYTRALLLLRRPPCWNKHSATRTTQHVKSRHDSHDTTCLSCRDVTQQVALVYHTFYLDFPSPNYISSIRSESRFIVLDACESLATICILERQINDVQLPREEDRRHSDQTISVQFITVVFCGVAGQFADKPTRGLVNSPKCLIENLEYIVALSVISDRLHYLYAANIR